MTFGASTKARDLRGEGRTARIAGAVGIGYGGQILTVVVGLWLTPFLLRRLGQTEYGLWLLAMQMTAYLSLLDLGIVALLPRETAFAIGRSAGKPNSDELPELIGRTLSVVLAQVPIVAAAAMIGLMLLPPGWAQLRGPLAILAAVFILMFPVRILHAVLQGLQDLAFLGRVSLFMWAIGAATTVGLVIAGAGLYAVSIGWAVSQAGSAVCWAFRMRARYAHVLPHSLPRISRHLVREQLQSGMWVTLAQVSQILMSGTDLLVIGRLLGPAAIVPYAVTGKLISVLSNQPLMVMQAAQPALSEIKATVGESERVSGMTTALSQLILLMSGGVFVVLLLVNKGFVSWWINPKQYAGNAVSFLLLTVMLLRHWNTTVMYSLLAFGHEKRFALTALLDGAVCVVASVLLVRPYGVIGVAVGSVIGVCAVSLPLNVSGLSSATGTPPAELMQPLVAWAVRFGCFVALGVFVASRWEPRSFAALAGTTVVTALTYVVVMSRVLVSPPLGQYTSARINSAIAYFPWLGSRPA